MIEGLLRPQHLLVILAVAVFVFGGKKLPELGKGLGEGIKGFRDSMRGITSDSEPNAVAPEPEKKA
jgi:sec-independent protein translocase protein TatA